MITQQVTDNENTFQLQFQFKPLNAKQESSQEVKQGGGKIYSDRSKNFLNFMPMVEKLSPSGGSHQCCIVFVFKNLEDNY